MTPKLIVVSGPSAVGIGEIVAALFARVPGLVPVVPVTARKMKEGERDGVGFFFFELEGWEEMKRSGDLLETTEFAGNDYGTSRKLVEEQFAQGNSVLMERELDRAAQIKRSMPEAICVYVEPSEKVLEERLKAVSRSTLELSLRLQTAAEPAGLKKGKARGCECHSQPRAFYTRNQTLKAQNSFSYVAITAFITAARNAPSSSLRTPWMVLPPGEQTRSLSASGCSPLWSSVRAVPASI